MVEIAVAILAYLAVSRIAKNKGFKGPVPGIVAALSFPAGILVGGLLFALFSPGPHPYTASGPYLPLVFQDLAYAVPVLVGLLLLAAVILYFVLIPKVATTEPVERKTRFPFRLLGVTFVLAGAGTMFAWGRGSYLWSMIGTGLFALAAQCFSLAKRSGTRTAEQVLASDKRRPVLYLRSFSLEHVLKTESTVSLVPWARKKTHEEELSEALSRRLGPMIALGNPVDYLPELGAARAYPSDANWFEVYQSFATKARCVLIAPGVSEGLMRELKYVREHIEADRVFVIIRSVTLADLGGDWSHFSTVMGQAGFQVLPGTPTAGSLLGFTVDWTSYVAGEELETPGEYAEAIVQALRQGPGSTFVGSSEQIRETQAYAFGWWLAATSYKVWKRIGRLLLH